MSLAIKFGNNNDVNSVSGSMYFDAVTSYNKNHGGRVTEHPIESGASITDHYISRNSRYTISGVFSHIDFSNIPSVLTLDGEGVMNNSVSPAPVSIVERPTPLTDLLGSLGQYFPSLRPEIVLDSQERLNWKLSFENFFEEILTGLFYNQEKKRWENRMTVSTLFEMDGTVPSKPIPDLVVTDVQITEDPDSGDALFVNMTLEKVRFVRLETAEAPRPVRRSETDVGTDPKKNKGNKPANVNDPKVEPKQRVTVQEEMSKAFGSN